MSRSRQFLVLLAVLAAAALVLPLLGRWLSTDSALARPLPVPGDDQEIAWLHTSTAGSTWERFVAGVQRVHGFVVDDSRAFLNSTTAVPEVVLSQPGRTGKLRIRWYKITSEAGSEQWVDALAERSPPPLAVIGGGSTDRAVDLAKALQDRTNWKGARPLLLITTATANEVFLDDNAPAAPSAAVALRTPQNLMHVYPGRSFRFCFTNEQMARAVVDFVWKTPDLRPQNGYFSAVAVLGAAAGLIPADGPLAGAPLRPGERPAHAFALAWADDPYSVDLAKYFHDVIDNVIDKSPLACRVPMSQQGLPFSVGLLYKANRFEIEAAEQILREAPTAPGCRSLLVVPTTAPPARRVLRALAGEAPLIGKRLVAVTGDGISFNIIYRDAAYAWPIRDLPIPLVLFTHQNPIAWDSETAGSPNGNGQLLPPNSTEDVLLFAELVRRVSNASFADDGGLVASSDELADRLRSQHAPFFDHDGNRIGGKGEFVVCLRPQFVGARVAPQALIEVWKRRANEKWELVGRLTR